MSVTPFGAPPCTREHERLSPIEEEVMEDEGAAAAAYVEAVVEEGPYSTLDRAG